MSTDSIFRSIPTTSLSDAQNKNIPTTSVVSAPASLNPHVITTPNGLTPSVELNNSNLFPNATLPMKKDISSIPPAFFVGPREKEDTVIVEPQFSTDSGSVVSDRRLSGILAEANDKREEEKEEAAVPVKRIVLGTVDANRGLFGDRRLKVIIADTKPVTVHSQVTTTEASPTTTTDILPTRTIRVFGYPPNLVHNVIQHFSNYGKIEKYQEAPGNWMIITFESSSMALSALKSNGMAISKNYLIGVSLEKEETTVEVEHVVPMDVSNGVFKKNKNGLGSGKVGISAESKDNASAKDFISRLKDTFLGW